MDKLLLAIFIFSICYMLLDTEMFATYKRKRKIIYKKNCEVIDVIKNSNEFYYSGDKYPIFDAFKSLKVVKKGDMLYFAYYLYFIYSFTNGTVTHNFRKLKISSFT